ncbi:MAG: hypothetical protein KF683_16955 [Rubrivivax sp.]|nr:hypothetical protein [Rubrivivax sp.]
MPPEPLLRTLRSMDSHPPRHQVHVPSRRPAAPALSTRLRKAAAHLALVLALGLGGAFGSAWLERHAAPLTPIADAGTASAPGEAPTRCLST